MAHQGHCGLGSYESAAWCLEAPLRPRYWAGAGWMLLHGRFLAAFVWSVTGG